MNIVLSMTSGRNAEEVVLFLKKQLLRTQEQDFDKVHMQTPNFRGLMLTPGRHQSTASS